MDRRHTLSPYREPTPEEIERALARARRLRSEAAAGIGAGIGRRVRAAIGALAARLGGRPRAADPRREVRPAADRTPLQTDRAPDRGSRPSARPARGGTPA